MLEKKAKNREQIEFICLENLAQQDHILRKMGVLKQRVKRSQR